MTLNSQQKLFTSSFSAINCNSSECLLPPSFKLVLFIGAKLIASIFFSLARVKAKSKASNTLLPDSLDGSANLYL